MSAHKEYGGNLREGAFSRWIRMHGFQFEGDPAQHGGLIRTPDSTIIGYLRGPYWRTPGMPHEQICRTDIGATFTEPKSEIDRSHVHTGSELEVFFVDRQGNPYIANNPTSPLRTSILTHNEKVINRMNHHSENGNGAVQFVSTEEMLDKLPDEEYHTVGITIEFINSCIELGFSPHTNGRKSTYELLLAMRTVTQLAEEHGAYASPSSVFGQRDIERVDGTVSPYIDRILDYMGWERVRHFIGSSFQVHAEMIDMNSALKAINVYQLVAPLLYATTLSGPFLGGTATPDLKEKYQHIPEIRDGQFEGGQKKEIYDNLIRGNHMSYRPYGRKLGSPSGLIPFDPYPDNQEEYFSRVQVQLQTNESPSVSRGGGHHTDRIRPDLPPHGTIEIGTFDTAGVRIQRLGAIQEFTTSLLWKLQILEKSGKLNDTMQLYPKLFGTGASRETFSVALHNILTVAEHGPHSLLVAMDGDKTTTFDLWQKLVQFTNEPYEDDANHISYRGLPPHIVEELNRAFAFSDLESNAYVDENGIPSICGYYETGLGIPSQWMLKRYAVLLERGYSEEQAVKNCLLDMGKSFHAHIKHVSKEEIVGMFMH